MQLRLAPEQIASALRTLPGWHLRADGAAITRSWALADFAEAFALAGRIAALAEEADHHPEIRVRWGEVVVILSTHDARGVSDLDVKLAARIDRATGAR